MTIARFGGHESCANEFCGHPFCGDDQMEVATG